jgi:hypothetical protein
MLDGKRHEAGMERLDVGFRGMGVLSQLKEV